MNKLILGTAIAAAMSSSAWAQVLADGDSYVGEAFDPDCTPQGPEDETCIFNDVALSMARRRSLKTDEVVISGTRLGVTESGDLTVPASILTEAKIAARGQQYVSDLLRALPGIAVSQSGSGAGVTQIRVRGAEANQVLVLVDGVEVANPSTGEFDLSGLRAADVVKIEVLRGEQSALYGSDAVAGVISIVTRAGETSERWRASVEAGSRDTLEGQFSAVVPLRGAALSVNATGFTTDGFDVSGLDGEEDGANSRSVNLGLNAVRLGPVRLDAKYGSSRLVTEFDEDADFNGRLDNTDAETQVSTDTARADARFDLGAVSNKISVGYLQTDTDTRAGFATRSVGERINASWVAGLDLAERHSVTALGEVERETYRIVPNFTEADAEPENETAALALDYGFDGGDLDLSASVRHDVNDLFADATTWRLGAGYDLPWEGRVRASVGTGVKNPSLIELFGFFPSSRFTGNRDLQPERSLGVSVGYEQDFGDLSASVDVFASELDDEIATIFNPDFTQTVVNLDTTSQRRGVEGELSLDKDAWGMSASATYLDSEQNGIREIRRPEFTASASAYFAPTDAIMLSAYVDHTGSQTDTDFATFSDVSLDAFTLVGARAAYTVRERVTLSVRGANLLDEDYQEIVGFASPGRAVFAGISADF